MGKANQPLVTIIIPVFNGSNYLDLAIDSALAQIYKNVEILVVDDGSIDDTEKIVRKYGNKIKYLKKQNGGVASALNYGVKNSKGDYISWLSHDDVYFPEKLDVQIKELNKIKDKNTIIYGSYIYIDKDSKILAETKLSKIHDLKKLDIPLYPLLYGILHGCTVLIKKSLLLEFGLFKENLQTTQDYDLWFDILRKHPVKYVDDFLVKSRSHDRQDSKNLSQIHISEGSDLWIKIAESLNEDEINSLKINKYKLFMELYQRMLGNGLYKPARRFLLKVLESDKKKKNILFITATIDGGLGRFINDLTKGLDDVFNLYTIYINGADFLLIYKGITIFNIKLEKPVLISDMYHREEVSELITQIIILLGIDITHINGFIFLGFKILEILEELKIPVVYTAHDYHLLCVSQFLLKQNSKYCGMCKDLDICDKCLLNNPYTVWLGINTSKELDNYRKFIKKFVFKRINKIVYPSKFVGNAFKHYYPTDSLPKGILIEHGIEDEVINKEIKREKSDKIIIGIIGNIEAHKGLEKIESIINSLNKSDFEFILFGKISKPIKNLIVEPLISYSTIISKLRINNISIVLILSQSPETFSYVLSESWVAGIPPIVTGIGALKERVEKTNAGFIVGLENTAEEVINLLNLIRKSPSILEEKRKIISEMKITSFKEMKNNYISIYNELLNDKKFKQNKFELLQIQKDLIISYFLTKHIQKEKITASSISNKQSKSSKPYNALKPKLIKLLKRILPNKIIKVLKKIYYRS